MMRDMSRKFLCLAAAFFAVCLSVILFWIFQPQIAHLREQHEERQRQTILDGKLRSLVKEVELDLHVQGEEQRLRPIAREIVDFICSTWSNREDRTQRLLKMENSLYNIDTAKLLETTGTSPVWMIYELTGEVMNGFVGMDNRDELIRKMKIRALGRIKKDLDLAIKLHAAEPARPEIYTQKRRHLDSMVSYTGRNFFAWEAMYEGFFNDDVKDGKISADQEREIRAYFEQILGHPIRTKEQISEAYERRRIKHPTDDDVKIDLGL